MQSKGRNSYFPRMLCSESLSSKNVVSPEEYLFTDTGTDRAATFVPMPTPRTVCRASVQTMWVTYDLCMTIVWPGYGYEYHSSCVFREDPHGGSS